MATTFPLTVGSTGDAVSAAQRWLNLALEIAGSNNRLTVDGKYGQATAKVVKNYFNRTKITEADYKLMRNSIDAMISRLKEIKASGKNPDNVLRNLISNDQQIFAHLLMIANLYDAASPAQRTTYQAQFQQAVKLGERLQKRVTALKSRSSEIKVQTGAPTDLQPLIDRYVKAVSGIGFAFLIPFIMPTIAGIIVTKTATGVYDWLTPHYRESTVDFKITKELRAVLDKLSPEDQKVVLDTAEKQLDAAYNEGNRDGNLGGGLFGGLSRTVKWVVIGGGAMLVTYFAWPLLSGARNAAKKKFG